MNRLVLIDGNAILHRAYHALPPLTAPDGSLVNAVYGFTAMLIRLFHDLNPTHIAVAFDRPKPTFRKQLFKEYQATRPKMDEELVGQIEKVHEVVRAFGIPILKKMVLKPMMLLEPLQTSNRSGDYRHRRSGYIATRC